MQALYSYLRADCIIVLLDIIYCYLIIVKVNLKARGFTEFYEITLPLHLGTASGIFRVYAQRKEGEELKE